jgi:uncharacterized protein (DUF58 family)
MRFPLYLSSRFFYLFGAMATLFALSFFWAPIYPFVVALFFLSLALVLADSILLFRPKELVGAYRKLPRQFSLGDENKVAVGLLNRTNLKLGITVIDELPEELQIRDFSKYCRLAPYEETNLHYRVRPVERGNYGFGKLWLFITSPIGLIERRVAAAEEAEIAVFPSVLQMKQFELYAFDRFTQQKGIKRLRRIGHSYEFEQIKEYVRGDDYRSINWKASSRHHSLMVNQYEDERAQQVYCLIDKSRVMRLPFEGMSLMEYAINATLVISNLALQKHDKAGLITFSDKIGTTLKAENRPVQLQKILQALYREKERDLEANYELLYFAARKLISGRSLLLLFSNFESMYALERVLPILRRINHTHLLVVLFFENTEIKSFAEKDALTTLDIYQQTVARNFLEEKNQMVQKLRQYGIQSILSRPEGLSIATINKYLELKSRGLI